MGIFQIEHLTGRVVSGLIITLYNGIFQSGLFDSPTVSQKVLTAQLRDMEEKGLLTRKVYAEVPPRVEYTLTETGYSLKTVLDAMGAWGADYQAKNG